VNRRLLVMAVLVVVSAIAVIELRHRNRTVFAQLQALEQARDAYEVEWGKLLLEEGAWSQHRRIESTAVSKLGMKLPDNAQVVMVDQRESGVIQ
jgi:cell division protein FtsL